MVSCNRTKRLIDEADHPESLSFEASSHVASCSDCESFAEDRARLRRLLASGSRVSVPMNFDAVLKSRLADAKARSAFGWLNPAGYLRLVAATAGLVVVVFAAQYAGLFRNEHPALEPQRPMEEAGNSPARRPAQTPATVPASIISSGAVRVAATAGRHQYLRRVREMARTDSAGVPLEIPGEDYLHQDGGVMLVRGSNGEGDVSLPMVSVGAQSLVYANAGASRRTTRTIGTSF
ncbi:MAG: hypothetical protein WAU45_13460 [Blastocatellia bacterium]